MNRHLLTLSIRLLTPLMGLFLPAALYAQDDPFIAGYATAILDREFAVSHAHIRVEKGVITVQAGDLVGRRREMVIAALSRIKGVKEVHIDETPPPPDTSPPLTGDQWQALPEGHVFPLLLGDPRTPNFSASYERFIRTDFPKLRNVAALSLGEDFSILRYESSDFGQLNLSLEPAIFAIFNLDDLTHDLVNADYRIGLPVEYRKGPFSFKLSVFHQSSHLGDGYPADLPHYLSYEAVDLKTAMDVGDCLVYLGASRMIDSNPSDLKRWSAQQGVEWISSSTFISDCIAPLVAVDVQEHQENYWRASVSVRAGVQWVNPEHARRRLQFLLEYYRGYDPNGQFYNERANWFGLGLHVYF